jgi:hypothetical protein
VSQAFNDGLVGYGWQTYAWSSGQWDDRALLRQVENNVAFGPAIVDHNQAAYWASATQTLGPSDDFGQWPRPVASKGPYRHVVARGNTQTIEELAASRHVSVDDLVAFSRQYLSPANAAVLADFLALDATLAATGDSRPPMPEGLVYWTSNP